MKHQPSRKREVVQRSIVVKAGLGLLSLLAAGNMYFIKGLVEKLESANTATAEYRAGFAKLEANFNSMNSKLDSMSSMMKDVSDLKADVAVLKFALEQNRRPNGR